MIHFFSLEQEEEFERKMFRLFRHQRLHERFGISWEVFIKAVKDRRPVGFSWE